MHDYEIVNYGQLKNASITSQMDTKNHPRPYIHNSHQNHKK